jgi:hypothetical protein
MPVKTKCKKDKKAVGSVSYEPKVMGVCNRVPSEEEFHWVRGSLRDFIGPKRKEMFEAILDVLEKNAALLAEWATASLRDLARDMRGFGISMSLLEKTVRYGRGQISRHLFRDPEVILAQFDRLPVEVQDRLNDPEGVHSVSRNNVTEVHLSKNIGPVFRHIVHNQTVSVDGSFSDTPTVLTLIDSYEVDNGIVLRMKRGDKTTQCLTTFKKLREIVKRHKKHKKQK